MLDFPVPVSRLEPFVPHRSPMVWVHEVLSIDDKGGTCAIHVGSPAPYTAAGEIRGSSFIEWMAQAFAYVEACRGLETPGSRPISRAFLVGIRDLRIEDTTVPIEGKLHVRVETIKKLEGLVLFRGAVQSANHLPLASGKLKIFAEYQSEGKNV